MLHKKYYSPSNVIILLIISIVCLFYFTWLQQFINPLFTSDSLIIKYFGLSSLTPKIHFFNNNAAYTNTVIFFKLLGFTSNTPVIYIHLFSWGVFQFVLFTIGRINRGKNFSKLQIVSIVFFSIMYGIFFTNYSKDILAIILFLIALNLYITNNNILYIIIFVFLYGMFFRIYWLITFLIWISILILKEIKKKVDIKNKISIKKNVLYIIILTILLILIDHENIFVTVRFSNNVANSAIHDIISNSSISSDIINYLYVLVNFIIPIQGISSVHMIIYYIWAWGVLFTLYKYRKILNNQQVEVFLLFVCFLSTQALFEPDFGSTLRHQLVFFVMIYLIFNKYSFYKESYKYLDDSNMF